MIDHLNESRKREFVVLLTISVGLILIIMAIVAGIYGWFRKPDVELPSWAENVLVAIATAAILKLGDCLNALVQLATGRQVSQLGEKLAASAPAAPVEPVPDDAVAGAQAAADSAQEKADQLRRDDPLP